MARFLIKMEARLALVIQTLIFCTFAAWSSSESTKGIDQSREVFSWRQVDFEFPDKRTRQAAIASGEYVQANNLPVGLEIWRNKLFITVPRWKAGVASTLNYVLLKSDPNRNRSPALVPYPNYETNRLPAGGGAATTRRPHRNNIISTFRVSVDHACDRLWAVDMGRANGTTYGPPRLLIVDLLTDRTIRRFDIPAELLRPTGDGRNTWFPALIADSEPDGCGRSHAYLPDLSGGLVVYSFRENAAWRLEHPYFEFDPSATEFVVGGVPVQWRDGAFGVALSGRRRCAADGHRTLYFQAMAGTRMFSADTRALRRRPAAVNGTAAASVPEYLRDRGRRPSGTQSGPVAADPTTGALFYALANRDAVGCWNPDRYERHGPDTTAVVAADPARLQYPADVKVDAASNVWVLSDRMPRFRYRVHEFDPTDVNIRVFRWPAADLVRGTVCELVNSAVRNSTRCPS